MMAEVKRWTVTYTKQIKQKRKVYQDGSIELRSSSNKVLLFDDCGQLLECRLLKKDEVVSSGETMMFCAYLVDIGDGEEEQKRAPELNICDKTIGQKRNSLHRQSKHGDSGNFRGRGKAGSDNQRDEQKCLSPSQRMIREFKKRELHKYGHGIVRSSPVERKCNMTEWRALYTTQLTQKAKRYHDGLLQMTPNGSLGRQIMLFDETGKLLEARFLKKAELVKSGESLLFDAYLVEVGEHQENHESHSDTVEENEVHKQQPKNNETAEREWNVLYTTHVTQKAKKYHEGFLKLAMCGSIRRKAFLYDSNRKVLDSRFIKQDETIKSGESFAFDAHLVDIGEREGQNEIILKPSSLENNWDIPGKKRFADAQHESLKANKCSLRGKSQYNVCADKDALSKSGFCSVYGQNSNKTTTERPLRNGKSQYNVSVDKDALSKSSSVDGQNSNKIATERPLRNALQILSVLQKPMDLKAADLKSIDKALASENLPINDICENILLPSSVTCQVSSTGVDYKKSIEVIDMEKSLHCMKHEVSSAKYFKDVAVDDSHKPHFNNEEANSDGSGSALACAISSSSSSFICDPDDHRRPSFEEINNVKEANECPSFDLGF